MRYLLAILSVVFLFSTSANAATRFWVGGTGTWDASDTTHWAATTGGAGGQSVPGSADSVTFDANSGGGTSTVAVAPTIVSLTFTNYTGIWDNTVGNYAFSLVGSGGVSVTQASGAAQLKFGSTTYSLSSVNPTVAFTTVTSVTITANSATFAFTNTAPTASRSLTLNGQTIGGLTIADIGSSSVAGLFTITPNTGGTIGTLNVGTNTRLSLTGGQTLIVSNAFNLNPTGSASAGIIVESSSSISLATISVASGTPTFNWAALSGIVGAGGATFSAVNSLNTCANSNITFTGFTGGAGGRIIGG